MDAIRGLFFRKLQNSVRTSSGDSMQAQRQSISACSGMRLSHKGPAAGTRFLRTRPLHLAGALSKSALAGKHLGGTMPMTTSRKLFAIF